MRQVLLWPVLLALTPIASATEQMVQSRALTDQYLSAVNNDLAQVKFIKKSAVTAPESISEITIKELDASLFPSVSGFISVRNAEGKHISALNKDDFKFTLHHPSLAGNISPANLLLTEIGTDSSKADIVFVIDTTGSMSGEIGVVRNNVMAFVDDLVAADIDYRLAGFSFGDEVPYRDLFNFSTDPATFKTWVSGLSADGGADWPENPLDSIIAAGSSLNWRPNAQQIILLITDAPAHVSGDGGNSATTATFSLASMAISDKTFYYSSPEAQYNSLGSSLNWPFNHDVLLSQLGAEVRGSYHFEFKDPIGKHDGLSRTLNITDPTNSYTRDNDTYTPDTSYGKIVVSVNNNDPVPRPIPKAIVNIIDNKGNTDSYTTNSNGQVEVKLEGDREYTISAHVPGLYAEQASTATTTINDENQVVVSQEKLDFNLSVITVKELKSQVRSNLGKIKAFDPGFLSSPPFEGPSTDALTWIETIPNEAEEGETGPSNAQKEGLRRMDVATNALNKSNSYIEDDAKVIGSNIAKIVTTTLDLTGAFQSIQKSLLRAAETLDPDAADWAVVRWTYAQVKKLLQRTASDIGKLSTSLTNLLLDVVKMNIDKEHHYLIAPIKNVIAVASANPNLPVIENMSQQVALEALMPVYANGVDTKFSQSVKHHSNVSTSLTAEALAVQLNRANNELEKMLVQAQQVKALIDTAGNVSDIVGALSGVVSTVDNLFSVLPGSVTSAIPHLNSIKVTIDVLDKGLKVADISIAAGNTAVASAHFNILDKQIEHVIDTTSSGINTSAFSMAATPRMSYSQANSMWDQLNKQTVQQYFAKSSTTPVYDFESAIKTATSLIEEDKFNEFFEFYLTTLLPAANHEDAKLNQHMVKIRSINLVPGAKPVNWDALSAESSAAHINLALLSLQSRLAITSNLLEMATLDDSQLSEVKSELQELLVNWQVSSVKVSGIIAQTSLEADKHLPYSSMASIENINIVSNTLDEDGKIKVSVSIVNSGKGELSYLAPVFSSEFLEIESVKAGDESTTYSAGEQYTHYFDLKLKDNVSNDVTKHTLYFAIEQTINNQTINEEQVLFAFSSPTDSDNDGMPDFWEAKFKLDPNFAHDALADNDNDNVPNLVEYQLGFDPTSAESVANSLSDLNNYTEMLIPGEKLIGDANDDGSVDANDITTLITSYGSNDSITPAILNADFNRNSTIDLFDINMLRKITKH